MAAGGELWIGAATADITPDRPVALSGQWRKRISTEIVSRVKANVLALESRDGDEILDQAILVACDLVAIRPGIQDGFRKHVAARLPGFDIDKLIMTATHTHSAPVMLQDRYQGYGDAMQPKEYVPFMYERIAAAVEQAWQQRAVGGIARGLGHAVVGQSRRTRYRDGSAALGSRNAKTPAFRGLEGYDDHAVDILFFYDKEKKLKATAITLACPAQSFGSSRSTQISADFWHDARELLKERHGNALCVLGFIAPAGDQGPGLMYRQQIEARMDKLRGLTRTRELGRRIANAFDDVLAAVQDEIRTDVALAHRIHRFDLPGRKVTEEEFARAKEQYEPLAGKKDPKGAEYSKRRFHKATVDRYLGQQKADPHCPVEMHVLRLGDVAIATSPFELFLEYGVRIQAGSVAPQTVLIQLASPTSGFSGYGVYLPTAAAARGGGYSANVESNMVGPEGGQELVERTVLAINELWIEPDVRRALERQSAETFSLAETADPKGWFQVDLKPFCNMNLYSKEGVAAPVRFHAMELGRRKFYGVPVDILDPAETDNKTALALPSRRYLKETLPETAEVAVGRKAKVLYFLYATYYTLPAGKQYFKINYADGDAHTIPFVGTKQSGDWFHVAKRVYSDNVHHVLVPKQEKWRNTSFYSMHLMQWANPEPGKAIKSITFKSDKKAEMAIFVAAITGHSGKGIK